MVNRVLAAKTLKLKRQKRLFPKKYEAGYIPVGGIKDGSKSVLAGLMRGRVSGKAFDDSFNKYVDSKYGNFNAAGSRHPGAIAAEEAALRITQQDDKHWPIKFKIISNNYQRAMCYAASGMNCFVIVHEDFKRRTVKRSITYSSKERILAKFYSDKITWVSSEPLKSG